MRLFARVAAIRHSVQRGRVKGLLFREERVAVDVRLPWQKAVLVVGGRQRLTRCQSVAAWLQSNPPRVQRMVICEKVGQW